MKIRTIVLSVVLGGCYVGDDAPAQPHSLAGTEVDGSLRAVNGVFVFDDEARRAFDYYLTAAGELNEGELDAWVRGSLADRLSGEAAEQAFAAWQAYVAYRGEAAAVLVGDDAAGAEARLQALALRELGEYAVVDSEQAEIARAFAVRGGSEEVAASEARVFDASEAGRFLAGRRATEIARLAGDDVAAVRREQFGVEAAARLGALDERRAAWDRRVAAFRAAREGLEDAEASALAREMFDAGELRRLHALERLAGR